MLDDADDSELLKTSAAVIMDLKERVEELEKQAEKRDLVDEVMDKLEKESMLTSYNEEEKRASLEKMSLDKLENVQEVLDNFVKNSKFKIGSVMNSDDNHQRLDPIESWLLGGEI